MAKEKMLYVASHHNGRVTIWGATQKEMNNRIFGYTLECGHSWNNKIPREPKGVKRLVKALNDSAYECRRYNDWYEEADQRQIAYFKENVSEGCNSVSYK